MSGAHRSCASGHDSTDDDYCSVCGARMPAPPGGRAAVGAVAVPSVPLPPSASAGSCPDCGEPRVESTARFCEVCRYDFAAQKPGPAPRVPAKNAASSAVPSVPSLQAGTHWDVVIQTDASLDTEPDAETPFEARADVVVRVDGPDLLIGRTDPARDIHPEIALHDPGASRRHAKIVTLADGSLALQDLASTNGTKLNGATVPRGGRSPLAHGDAIVIGRWTKLTLRRSS